MPAIRPDKGACAREGSTPPISSGSKSGERFGDTHWVAVDHTKKHPRPIPPFPPLPPNSRRRCVSLPSITPTVIQDGRPDSGTACRSAILEAEIIGTGDTFVCLLLSASPPVVDHNRSTPPSSCQEMDANYTPFPGRWDRGVGVVAAESNTDPQYEAHGVEACCDPSQVAFFSASLCFAMHGLSNHAPGEPGACVFLGAFSMW